MTGTHPIRAADSGWNAGPNRSFRLAGLIELLIIADRSAAFEEQN